MNDGLLTVDFEAALAKLAPAQLQGSWQLPAELARLAIAGEARRVELTLGRARLVLAASGARLEAARLYDLAQVLDPEMPLAERHLAFSRLEARGDLALMTLAALPGCSLELESGGGKGLRLTVRPGRKPRLEPGGEELALTVTGLELDTTAAASYLERHGRFSPVPIAIDGRNIARGFRGTLVRTQVTRPLPAALAIPMSGEASRLWLLCHGIISARATVPGYPPFEGAVEMAGTMPGQTVAHTASHTASRTAPSVAAGDLREAVRPYLDELIATAMGLVAHVAEDAGRLPEVSRQRTARLLLLALRHDYHRRRLAAAAVFPRLDEMGRRELVSLEEIEASLRLAGGRERQLDALSPEQDPADFLVAGRRLLVVSAGERALLAERLNATFHVPPPRPRPRRGARRVVTELWGSWALAWHGIRGRLLAETALDALEQRFLAVLASSRGDGTWPEVVFREGGGAIRIARGGRLLLPRRHPDVRAALRAVARDPGWLYPALLALGDGYEMPADSLRTRWRQTVSKDGASL